jgi:hypothetical protein
MSKDFRSYLDELLEKRPKDVVVVDKEIDPRYEASAIVEKFERKNEFHWCFQNIKARKFPRNKSRGYYEPAYRWARHQCHRWSRFGASRHNPVPVKEFLPKNQRSDPQATPPISIFYPFSPSTRATPAPTSMQRR